MASAGPLCCNNATVKEGDGEAVKILLTGAAAAAAAIAAAASPILLLLLLPQDELDWG
jgi:hypothetical protein